jgi:uncharacterized membrane protein YfcA
MILTPEHYALGGVSGLLVGFILGLVGGGGSVLAVPLLLYVVGVRDPHQAIGTSAFAVAANALAGLASHARAGTVNWRCGGIFAGAGVAGALAGSTLGKAIDGQKLLFLFALLMLVVAGLMFRGRGYEGVEGARCNRGNIGKVLAYGFGIGGFSGFFGIGGGFLIVPGLMASTAMPILGAIGTSLIAVTAFGLTTSLNYAMSGFVIWPLAAIFIVGGMAGTIAGTRASQALADHKGRLNVIFAGFVALVAVYVLFRSWAALNG